MTIYLVMFKRQKGGWDVHWDIHSIHHEKWRAYNEMNRMKNVFPKVQYGMMETETL